MKSRYLFTVLALSLTLSAAAVADHRDRVYEVKITNLTRGQSFTPILNATHIAGLKLFQLGAPASEPLAILAEDGNPEPLAGALQAADGNTNTATVAGLTAPGATATIEVTADRRAKAISVAAMLIPTNDAFVALNGVHLPRRRHRTAVYYARAYDAGSEPNDELCANIPGPVCQGAGSSPDVDGEGYVHVHAGIHSNGDDINTLNAAERDWRNPVARIEIRRIR